jgi:hypothetical protein
MLVRFSSAKTESILLFGDVAKQLIGMLGASGAVPGAIGAEDIPAAVRRLRQELSATALGPNEESQKPATLDQEMDDERAREPPVSLSNRAIPLIDILERAAAAKAPVMWEKA